MNKKIIIVPIFLVLIIAFLNVISLYVVNTTSVKASPKMIVVPDNYPTIGAAISNASEGETILVKNGIYFENLQVLKPLSIIGENSKNTIIVGGQSAHVIYIKANNVKVSGFTIENANYSDFRDYYIGVYLDVATGCNISGNNIVNNLRGVETYRSQSCVISGNNVTANKNQGLIIFGDSNAVFGNNVTNNGWAGIVISGSSNTISGNNIKNNGEGGICVTYSSNLNVFGNNITENNGYGVSVYSSNNTFYYNNFINNTQNVYIGSPSCVEFWSNGEKGNYWSDYNGLDENGDGIGDTPYLINSENQDDYPLLQPYLI